MIDIIELLNKELNTLNIPYAFDEWDKTIKLPQFIGELFETPTKDEDGLEEYSFILNGYGTTYLELLEYSNKLKEKYKTGAIVDGMVIIYESTNPIDNDTEDLKQIEIKLKIKNWSI